MAEKKIFCHLGCPASFFLRALTWLLQLSGAARLWNERRRFGSQRPTVQLEAPQLQPQPRLWVFLGDWLTQLRAKTAFSHCCRAKETARRGCWTHWNKLHHFCVSPLSLLSLSLSLSFSLVEPYSGDLKLKYSTAWSYFYNLFIFTGLLRYLPFGVSLSPSPLSLSFAYTYTHTYSFEIHPLFINEKTKKIQS